MFILLELSIVVSILSLLLLLLLFIEFVFMLSSIDCPFSFKFNWLLSITLDAEGIHSFGKSFE